MPQKVSLPRKCSQNKALALQSCRTALLPSVPADPTALPPALLLHIWPPSPTHTLSAPGLQHAVPEACSREAFTLHSMPGHQGLYPLTESTSLFQDRFSLLCFSCKLNTDDYISPQSALSCGYLCASLIFFTSLRIHGKQSQEISLTFL